MTPEAFGAVLLALGLGMLSLGTHVSHAKTRVGSTVLTAGIPASGRLCSLRAAGTRGALTQSATSSAGSRRLYREAITAP